MYYGFRTFGLVECILGAKLQTKTCREVSHLIWVSKVVGHDVSRRHSDNISIVQIKPALNCNQER